MQQLSNLKPQQYSDAPQILYNHSPSLSGDTIFSHFSKETLQKFQNQNQDFESLKSINSDPLFGQLPQFGDQARQAPQIQQYTDNNIQMILFEQIKQHDEILNRQQQLFQEQLRTQQEVIKQLQLQLNTIQIEQQHPQHKPARQSFGNQSQDNFTPKGRNLNNTSQFSTIQNNKDISLMRGFQTSETKKQQSSQDYLESRHQNTIEKIQKIRSQKMAEEMQEVKQKPTINSYQLKKKPNYKPLILRTSDSINRQIEKNKEESIKEKRKLLMKENGVSFTPTINKRSQTLDRSVDDLIKWNLDVQQKQSARKSSQSRMESREENNKIKLCPGTIKILTNSTERNEQQVGEMLYKRAQESLQRKKEQAVYEQQEREKRMVPVITPKGMKSQGGVVNLKQNSTNYRNSLTNNTISYDKKSKSPHRNDNTLNTTKHQHNNNHPIGFFRSLNTTKHANNIQTQFQTTKLIKQKNQNKPKKNKKQKEEENVRERLNLYIKSKYNSNAYDAFENKRSTDNTLLAQTDKVSPSKTITLSQKTASPNAIDLNSTEKSVRHFHNIGQFQPLDLSQLSTTRDSHSNNYNTAMKSQYQEISEVRGAESNSEDGSTKHKPDQNFISFANAGSQQTSSQQMPVISAQQNLQHQLMYPIQQQIIQQQPHQMFQNLIYTQPIQNNYTFQDQLTKQMNGMIPQQYGQYQLLQQQQQYIQPMMLQQLQDQQIHNYPYQQQLIVQQLETLKQKLNSQNSSIHHVHQPSHHSEVQSAKRTDVVQSRISMEDEEDLFKYSMDEQANSNQNLHSNSTSNFRTQ